ncbi:MAG: ABC transporter permease [Candidatus Moduliflexus flocculans]|nr:ABC transporter permease [Candidatus Moduliflexus flocculans]
MAVGLACCALMMLWVRDELGFDRFHANGDSIFRLLTETKNGTAVALDARAPTPLGPAVKAEIPEVLDFCRYRTNKTYGVKLGDKKVCGRRHRRRRPLLLHDVHLPVPQGRSPRPRSNGPRSIVVTESLARTFFGDEDPMGKLLTVSRDSYTVTGVIRDVPENSHLHFACVIPSVNMHDYHHVDFENWGSLFFNCYVRLAPHASPAEAAAKMSGLIAKRLNKPNVALRAQPLKDIHLRSDLNFDLDNHAPGSASTLTLFSLAAAAILLLACINFMNLATARSANRGKEVGLRKVTGARRSDIVTQFLGESIVLSFLGLGLALLLLWIILPLFNGFAGQAAGLLPNVRSRAPGGGPRRDSPGRAPGRELSGLLPGSLRAGPRPQGRVFRRRAGAVGLAEGPRRPPVHPDGLLRARDPYRRQTAPVRPGQGPRHRHPPGCDDLLAVGAPKRGRPGQPADPERQPIGASGSGAEGRHRRLLGGPGPRRQHPVLPRPRRPGLPRDLPGRDGRRPVLLQGNGVRPGGGRGRQRDGRPGHGPGVGARKARDDHGHVDGGEDRDQRLQGHRRHEGFPSGLAAPGHRAHGLHLERRPRALAQPPHQLDRRL